MQTKVLLVAVVENEAGDVLMRKKPAGSPPYAETWYIFGAELLAGHPLNETLQMHVQKQAGIIVDVKAEIGWGAEVKADLDGVVKQFVYLDVLCSYVQGNLQLSEGVEKLEWVPKSQLGDYDIVPPSRILFKKLGYL